MPPEPWNPAHTRRDSRALGPPTTTRTSKKRPVEHTDGPSRKIEVKAREATSDRAVPIPPVPVAILRAHLNEFGTAPDGRLFANERGAVVGSSTYWRVWEDARPYALPPDRVASPLAGRPYDLRHACITRWLNAGVPIAEVARRVGNSPEVIHRRYHGCIDGHEEPPTRRSQEFWKRKATRFRKSGANLLLIHEVRESARR
jgi:integrase